MGDAGSFVLALGIGLLLAARDPLRHRLMIAAALVGTFVHKANHAYGDLALDELPAGDVFRDLFPLVIFAVLITAAYVMAVSKQRAA